eukprot:1995420-Pleurochrysis_carterae.AAC.1
MSRARRQMGAWSTSSCAAPSSSRAARRSKWLTPSRRKFLLAAGSCCRAGLTSPSCLPPPATPAHEQARSLAR